MVTKTSTKRKKRSICAGDRCTDMKCRKRNFLFDNFEIIYMLDDKVVGRYKTSPAIQGFFTLNSKTIQHNLTWAERVELDDKIADLISKEHQRLIKRKR